MQKTKKLLTIGITAIVFLWTLAMMPVPSSAGDITINGSGDYQTIQAAIDAAGSGDTVQVAAGTYAPSTSHEVFPINMRDGVSLLGAGADPTILDAENPYTNVVINCSNIGPTTRIEGFTITGGTSGIYNSLSSPTITNNIITGNSYGIDNNMSSPVITNNTITGNNYSGICIYYYSWPSITNNIITNNVVYGIYNLLSWPTIDYNDVWNNGAGTMDDNYRWCSPGDNDLYGVTAGDGLGKNPEFVDPGNDDYHLQAGSPCIDKGDNEAVPEWLTTDFDGNPRIIDGDNDGFDVVDMGAFEYQVSANQPPVADAGPDQTVEQESYDGTEVTLDGSGSTDPDTFTGTNNDIVSFDWYEGNDLLGNGEIMNHTFPLGIHTVILVVTDSFEETDDDEVIIVVQDTTPPEISMSVSTDSLWPPNHRMVDVGFFEVSDICDSNPDVSIDVTSDEPTATAPGAGGKKHSPDAEITDDGKVFLRAERSGKGDGRIYVITVTAIDASGNIGSSNVSVKVNHSKKKEAVDSGQNYDATQIN